jgi:hypothetical protein
MTDNTELQRLTRLRRLRRQIAAGLQADLDREQAFQVHGSVRELLKGGRAEVRRAGWLRAVVERRSCGLRSHALLLEPGLRTLSSSR